MAMYENVYHRAIVKKIGQDHHQIFYVDIGIVVRIRTNEIQLKPLMKYFSECPCLSVKCRLDNLDLNFDQSEKIKGIFNRFKDSCEQRLCYVKPCGVLDDFLEIKIFGQHNGCLNDILIENQLAKFRSGSRYVVFDE